MKHDRRERACSNTTVGCTSPAEFAAYDVSKEHDVDINSPFSEDESVSIDTQDVEELRAQLMAQIDAIINRETKRNESLSTDVMDTEVIESDISDVITDAHLDNDLNALLSAEISKCDSIEKETVSRKPSASVLGTSIQFAEEQIKLLEQQRDSEQVLTCICNL